MAGILFLVPRMNIGGAETYVYTAAKALHERGWEVCVASGGGQLADSLVKLGIPTYFLPIRLSRPLSAFFLERIVKKHHIRLIHANSGAAGIVAEKVKSRTGIPVVYTAHGIFGNPEREYVIDRLDRIVCVSQYVKDDAIRRGFSENHMVVRYSGIDTKRFTADEGLRQAVRSELGIPEGVLTLAIVSRIKNLYHKGHGHLLSMFATYGKNENWRLLVIGKGRGLSLLKKRIQSLGLSERVYCLGHHTDVERYVNGADVMVLPSRFETFGLVLAEGMAMGKPAIAFATGGTPEVIDDGYTGFLVEQGNERELYEKINCLDKDRVLLKQMSGEGIRQVRERFSLEKMIDDLENIYADFDCHRKIKRQA
ncbi:MAG: glycosyltransferase family 4 protein [Dialister sp.]|nr:glycosyltransferase family 4 protein [Dialister sp.]